MSLRNDPLYAEAIVFFEDKAVVKEMLYVEFQAVLDGVVGIPEFARKAYRAAYVTIWRNLGLNTVVLFNLRFDRNGHVESGWDLPLRALARNAVKGPDLGEGPVHLLTRTSCEEPDYTNLLWDARPHELEILTSLRDAVQRNRLGLYVENEERRYGAVRARGRKQTYMLGDSLDDDQQQELIANIEATLKFKYDQQLKLIEKQHEELVRQLEAQNTQLMQERENQQKLIGDLENHNKDHVDMIVEKYKAKLESDLLQTKTQLEEALNLKELELSYSQDDANQLRDDLEQLETNLTIEKARHLENFLKEMEQCGIEFIITQSGVGSYSLKLGQLEDYLRNPTGFWAQRCGVSEADYLAWWQHYKDPVCQAGRTTGCQCRAEVRRVNNPAGFSAGVDDMCAAHRFQKVKEVY